jgi:hypothetical protein
LISGAGQIRARGRLALFAKVGDIDALIAQAINAVREIRTSKQAFSDNFQVSSRDGVEVFIVGSLAGGTGSGTFLDTAFLTREHLNNFSNITGVFVLPRVFANIPQTHLVKSNAYGALKEIEHFWGLSPSNSIEIDYGIKKIKAVRPSFDAVFLIDGVNKNGTVVGRPDDLQNLVADGLYIQIGSQIGLDAANVADNIRAYLATGEKVRGRNINYCSFGFATLTLPVQQYERMKLKDAQSLLKNELMASTPAIDLESDIIRFLEDCKLAEATTLLNALTESDRGGQMKPEFRIGEIRQDRTALPTIKELYKRQLDQFEQRTAQELGLSFYRLEQTASGAIATFWERGLNRTNRLAYVLEFLSKLSQKKVYRDIEQSYHEVNRQGSNDNPFIHTIQRINLQSKRPKVAGEDFIRWHREQSQTLTNWSEKKAEDVKNEILKFVNEAYYPLTNMTVEQVLADSNPEDAGQDLQQLGKLAVPLWQYEVSEIPIQQQHLITEFYYYGVESNNTIFSDPPLSNRLPKGNNNPSFVPTGEPHKVMLFRVEVGVPLFAFNGMRELESAYLDPNKVFKHLHRNWTNLANLIPPEDDGGALRWFALALAPDPYKLVVNQSKKYFVSTEQAKRLEGGVLPLGSDRKSAFKAFKTNLPLVKEIADKVERITHEDQDKAKSTLQNYINHLNQVLKGGKVDAQIQEQVEMEIQEIEAYLEDLDVII